MSLPTISGTAKLLNDPKRGVTKTNQPMATVVLKFVAWRKTDDRWVEGDHAIAAAIAFEDTARDLAAFAKGDDVTVEGTATLGMWQDKPQLRITLATVTAAARKRERVAA